MTMTTPVRSVKNQYLGINAHLHSLWQGEGGWSGFHTVQIGDILKTLRARLIPMGYIADAEQSLQIRRLDASPTHPRADVLVYDPDPQRPLQPISSSASVAQTMTLAELLDEDELSEKPYEAVVIYEFDSEKIKRGKPVAWLELLSPGNKGESDDTEIYRRKRLDVLVSGLVFVELDYLHETPPTFHTLPSYRPVARRGGHSSGSPYRIIVIDPRPELERGPVQVIPFGVDHLIPTAIIPLNAGDTLTFDFGIPYRKTFEEGVYGYELDYRALPLNLNRYTQADQARIVCRMLSVLKAAQAGRDLEQGPFPIESLPLEEALAHLKTFTENA